jgi:hypothetical protein
MYLVIVIVIIHLLCFFAHSDLLELLLAMEILEESIG